jgi:hypothetical protein
MDGAWNQEERRMRREAGCVSLGSDAGWLAVEGSHRVWEIAAPQPPAAKLHEARPKPSQWKPSANHPWRKSVLPSPSVSSIRPPAAAVQALR